MSDAESRINIGVPVEWMVDPENPTIALGVIYEFTVTKERKTAWYTPDGKPALHVRIITRDRVNKTDGG